MTRFAAETRVFFIEEPVFAEDAHARPELALSAGDNGVTIATPLLPRGLGADGEASVQRQLLDELLNEQGISDYIVWYYTAMALRFSRHLAPALVVYDCMDELSAFQGAPPELVELEAELFERASVVFTGGQSLFEAKRHRHANVHAFPSSVDISHFGKAREASDDPRDQAAIPHPRIGFFGVLDERLDRDLLHDCAERRPEWHFVLIGPVVKIRHEDLPVAPNVHYLGHKGYAELPLYLANWDVAILPFAMNASTRFISPTKTPEYLAAGKPVVSSPIHDVVHPYGELGLVRIAAGPEEFVAAIDAALGAPAADWIQKSDEFLALNSWDKTFEAMRRELLSAMNLRAIDRKEKRLANV